MQVHPQSEAEHPQELLQQGPQEAGEVELSLSPSFVVAGCVSMAKLVPLSSLSFLTYKAVITGHHKNGHANSYYKHFVNYNSLSLSLLRQVQSSKEQWPPWDFPSKSKEKHLSAQALSSSF